MSGLYQKLSEQFPQEMERTLTKGGTNLTYIPVSEVITRMNKVLGVENWSFSIKGYTEIGDSIVAHVTVVAVIEGKEVSRDGVGGQKIKRIKATGLAVDYGDEVKGAVSDALKKAVQTLGIGLYLARSDDAMDIESAIDASNTPPSEHEQKWENFKGISKALTKDQREQLAKAWTETYNNKPKPTSALDVDSDTLDFLVAQAVAAQMGGSVVPA
jgi:hypothetical protein